jgi:hypothetical protein
MAISKGKHVDSSRTDYSHYSKNSSDLGSEGPEKRASQTPGVQNSTNPPACDDDLESRPVDNLDALLGGTDLEDASDPAVKKVIAAMGLDDPAEPPVTTHDDAAEAPKGPTVADVELPAPTPTPAPEPTLTQHQMISNRCSLTWMWRPSPAPRVTWKSLRK